LIPIRTISSYVSTKLLQALIKKLKIYDNFIIYFILIKIFKQKRKNFIIYCKPFVTVGNRYW
jgi:hypothetical protein